VNAGNERRTEIARDHQMAQGEVVDIAERLRGTTDILRRHEVTAPQSGRVTELRYFTAGGVIPAGAPILDVVPQDDELVVEARVQPTDIDAVQVGQSAWVKLTAYKQRDVPPVEGEVISVSADRLQDERQGYPYFAARIRLKPERAGALSGVELYPGMPAEAMIRGQARKAIDYFISPLTDSMRRAFREQ
jgi:HlyD family secretion protein